MWFKETVWEKFNFSLKQNMPLNVHVAFLTIKQWMKYIELGFFSDYIFYCYRFEGTYNFKSTTISLNEEVNVTLYEGFASHLFNRLSC